MAKVYSYTKNQLDDAMEKAKKQIIQFTKKEVDFKLNKENSLKFIAEELGLKSQRTLWDSKYKEEIDQWYQELKNNLKVKKSSSVAKEKAMDEQVVNDYKQMIHQLEKRVEELTKENIELRMKTNKR